MFVRIFELAKKQRVSVSFATVVFSKARDEFAYPSVGVMKKFKQLHLSRLCSTAAGYGLANPKIKILRLYTAYAFHRDNLYKKNNII